MAKAKAAAKPLVSRSVAHNSRRAVRAVESFKTAAEAIGPIESGMCVFALTRGQFSMIDVVQYLLSAIGGGHLSIWTWAIAEYDIDVLTSLMRRPDILSGRLVLDQSAEKRNPPIVESWRVRFGVDQVRILRNHAKLIRVWNDEYRFLARGSFNLNFNPRTEQMDLDEGSAAFDLVAGIEDTFPVLKRNYSSAQAMAAGKLDAAFPPETLAMFVAPGVQSAFGKIKPWVP